MELVDDVLNEIFDYLPWQDQIAMICCQRFKRIFLKRIWQHKYDGTLWGALRDDNMDASKHYFACTPFIWSEHLNTAEHYASPQLYNALIDHYQVDASPKSIQSEEEKTTLAAALQTDVSFDFVQNIHKQYPKHRPVEKVNLKIFQNWTPDQIEILFRDILYGCELAVTVKNSIHALLDARIENIPEILIDSVPRKHYREIFKRAVQKEHSACIDLLLSKRFGFDVESSQLLVTGGNFELIKKYFKHLRTDRSPLVYHAVKSGSLSITEWLFEHEMKNDRQRFTHSGGTLVESSYVFAAIETKSYTLLQWVLRQFPNFNVQSLDRRVHPTFIHDLVGCENLEIVRWYMRETQSQHCVQLHMVLCQENHIIPEIVEALITAGMIQVSPAESILAALYYNHLQVCTYLFEKWPEQATEVWSKLANTIFIYPRAEFYDLFKRHHCPEHVLLRGVIAYSRGAPRRHMQACHEIIYQNHIPMEKLQQQQPSLKFWRAC